MIHFLSVVVVALSPAVARAENCSWQFDPAQVVVGFTAYKTSEKAAVHGRFLQVGVKGKAKGKGIVDLLSGLSATVNVASLETDNPARNATLQEGFFKHLAQGMKIEGRVDKAKGTDSKGEFVLKLRMNAVEKPVKMSYTASEAAGFEASGTIDVLADFHARESFDGLHALCNELHKGKDGVSKTWPDVKISLKAPVAKVCSE